MCTLRQGYEIALKLNNAAIRGYDSSYVMLMIALRVGPVSASQATVAVVLVGLRKRKKWSTGCSVKLTLVFGFTVKWLIKTAI